eukprot:1149170-Pelagomonas_calceolata.AAC.1
MAHLFCPWVFASRFRQAHAEKRSANIHLNVIGVTKEGSKMKGMPYSFKQTNETYHFISEPVDILCVADTVQQAEQPNYLAEGKIPLQPLATTKPPNPSLSAQDSASNESDMEPFQEAWDFLGIYRASKLASVPMEEETCVFLPKEESSEFQTLQGC